jgi:hypothetical protein
MNYRPVFIGGCDRSGTTLLGNLLGCSPWALTTPESQFMHELLLHLKLMSGGSNDELMAIAINEVGVIKYLKKPINRSQLKKTLLSALSHHRESIEIARLKENYRNVVMKMHGVPYSVRRARKAIRIILHNATDLTTVACSSIAVMMGFSFILGIFLFLLLYIVKMLFGIDLFSAEHLSSLLVQA